MGISTSARTSIADIQSSSPASSGNTLVMGIPPKVEKLECRLWPNGQLKTQVSDTLFLRQIPVRKRKESENGAAALRQESLGPTVERGTVECRRWEQGELRKIPANGVRRRCSALRAEFHWARLRGERSKRAARSCRG